MLNVHRKKHVEISSLMRGLKYGSGSKRVLGERRRWGFFSLTRPLSETPPQPRPVRLWCGHHYNFLSTWQKKKKKKVLYFFQGAFLTSLCSLEKNLSHKVPLDKCIQAYEDLFKDSSDPRRFHRGCSDSQQGGRRASLCLSSWRLKSHERLMFKVACVASRRRPAGRA